VDASERERERGREKREGAGRERREEGEMIESECVREKERTERWR
jgi:hypothetical protein